VESGAIRRKGFRCRPHLAPRSPPCKFCDCILQGAIDFAALRSEAELEAWQALHLSLTFSRLSVFKK